MSSLILRGTRLVHLQKWRHSGVSLNPSHNASAFLNSFFSTSASQDGRKSQNFTISYLVESLGLTTKLAQSILKKVSSVDKGNPDSVLNLLKSYGFTVSQISTIVTDYPRLLTVDAKKSLGPKLQFLQSRGASTSDDLTQVLSKVPKILGKRGLKTITIYYDFVKQIIEADKSSKYIKLSHSLPQGCIQENKMRNLLVLRDLGMPQKLLFSLLISSFKSVCGKQRFEHGMNKVVEMGFDPTNFKFVQALNVLYQTSEKAMQEKFQVYKSLGFTEEDVWRLFKKYPISLAFSEKNILNSSETFLGLGFTREEFKIMVTCFPQCIGHSAQTVTKKTEFLVKKMNWPLKALCLRPHVFGCSMEKRIVPRCNVIKTLMTKGLLGSELPPLSSVLSTTDQVFLNMYVRKHHDKQLVPELMAIFTGDHAS